MGTVIGALEERVIARRGFDVGQFREALIELAGTTATVSAGEWKVLAEIGVPDHAMTAEANQQAKLRRLFATEMSRREVEDQTLTTTEVAGLLGLKGAAQVRNLLARRRIYAIPRTHRESLFPRWQFTSGQILPHLGEVLAALPDDLHPLDVQALMTSPAETLGGRSPAEWLATGGPAAPVADLADQQGWV